MVLDPSRGSRHHDGMIHFEFEGGFNYAGIYRADVISEPDFGYLIAHPEYKDIWIRNLAPDSYKDGFIEALESVVKKN